jgi:hypothetical protein
LPLRLTCPCNCGCIMENVTETEKYNFILSHRHRLRWSNINTGRIQGGDMLGLQYSCHFDYLATLGDTAFHLEPCRERERTWGQGMGY